MAFKMKGYSPFNKGKAYKASPLHEDESWWTRTKRQFSKENKYGFGDARGRDKSASTAQIKHQQKNPRKRGETTADYKTRIGKPPSRQVADQRGIPGMGESSQK
tara:strand:+ start:1876 stop:2187 length:312 start_codon:yes stop_codon:yes gene_type:complete